MIAIRHFWSVLFLTGCSGPAVPHPPSAQDRAVELAQRFIIVDGHIDVPHRLETSRAPDGSVTEDVARATASGNFDWPRARAGGLDAPFMSIYVPAELETIGGAKMLADRLIDLVEGLARAAPDRFALANTPSDVRRNTKAGLVSLPMGMENGSPIEGDLKNVAHFHGRGIRYITLTHSLDNHIADSSYDTRATHGGLSPFGVRVVEEMNRLGIMIDVSHLSDAAIEDVLTASKTPVLASHSSCRHFTPGWQRNISDEHIKAVGAAGGVVMINFGSGFLDGEIRERGSGFSSVEKVADHIEHVRSIAGVQAVGLGSDFDGVGDSLPVGLKDVSMYPNLLRALLTRGWSEGDIELVCGANALRVWQAVEDHASRAK